MKKILFPILFLFIYAACSPEAELIFEVQEFSPDSDAVHAEGGKCNINFVTSQDWTANSDSWIHLSSSSGSAGTISLTATTEANDGSARTGKITIETGESSKTVFLTQYPRIFTVKPRESRNLKCEFSMSYSRNTFTKIIALINKPQTNMYQTIVESFTASNVSTVRSKDNVNECWFKNWTSPSDGGVYLSLPFNIVSNSIRTDFDKIDGYEEYDINSFIYKTYTGTDSYDGQKYVDPDNNAIKACADQLWKEADGDIVKYARKASTWTANNIPYTRMNTGIHPVQDILDNGGDCGNQASIFISLLRAKGIPARHVVLCRIGSFHVRAEFYLAGYGWIPADPNGEQSVPGIDWFGNVDYDADAVVMSQGMCLTYNLPVIGQCTCILGQGLSAYWFWWSESSPYNVNFRLDNN